MTYPTARGARGWGSGREQEPVGVLTREEGEEQGPGEQSHSGNSVQFRHGAATQPTGQMRPQSPWSGTCRERPPAHAHQEHLTLSICSWGSLWECLFPLSFLHPTTWVRPLLQPPVLSTASPRKPPPSKDSPPPNPLESLPRDKVMTLLSFVLSALWNSLLTLIEISTGRHPTPCRGYSLERLVGFSASK